MAAAAVCQVLEWGYPEKGVAHPEQEVLENLDPGQVVEDKG